jgi:fused signal recognition particle receptor
MADGFWAKLKTGLSRTAEAMANLLARPMDQQSIEQLRELFIAGDFGVSTANEAVAAAQKVWQNDATMRKAGPAEAAAAVIESHLQICEPWQPQDKSKPLVLMLLGVNGAGKTTTAAKLVAHWQMHMMLHLLQQEN